MNIKNLFKNEFIFTLLQIVFIIIGFLMIFIEIEGNIEFGDNVWNARIYKFTTIASIGLGVAFTGKTFVRKLKRFVFIFGILFLSLIFLGGGVVFQDMLSGVNYYGGNMFIAFDCSMLEPSPEVLIIENIIPIIMCVVIILYSIYMFFKTETKTEKIQFLIQLSLPILLYILWVF